jgi:hypothetical protein
MINGPRCSARGDGKGERGLPIVNYGVLIACVQGYGQILELSPWRSVMEEMQG